MGVKLLYILSAMQPGRTVRCGIVFFCETDCSLDNFTSHPVSPSWSSRVYEKIPGKMRFPSVS